MSWCHGGRLGHQAAALLAASKTQLVPFTGHERAAGHETAAETGALQNCNKHTTCMHMANEQRTAVIVGDKSVLAHNMPGIRTNHASS